MYLCGHPGTGKTSLLNQVLSQVKRQHDDIELFLYNAMTYTDVRSFAITVHQDVTERLIGKPCSRIGRNSIDDEDAANIVANALMGTNKGRNKETGELQSKKHKIIVIDEVDQFQSNEKAFTLLIKAILKGNKSEQTNTSIVGIANSVDLPFRKKHSAIAMRDCQYLFKPYDTEQLINIM